MEQTKIKRPPLRIRDVAAQLGTHRDTVYRWITNGIEGADGALLKLRASRVGGVLTVRRRDLRAFLDGCQADVGKPKAGGAVKRRADAAVREFERIARKR